LVVGLVVPSAYGFLTGIALDTSRGIYVVLVILAAIGGVLAGFEMYGSGQGAVRGLVGGALFGGFVLIAHQVVSGDATVKLPHPAIVLLVFTIVPGVLLGSWGGRLRFEVEERREGAPAPFDLGRIGIGELVGTHHDSVDEMMGEMLTHERHGIELYHRLLRVAEGSSVALEELARQMIRSEEMHVAEIEKMLRKRGDA